MRSLMKAFLGAEQQLLLLLLVATAAANASSAAQLHRTMMAQEARETEDLSALPVMQPHETLLVKLPRQPLWKQNEGNNCTVDEFECSSGECIPFHWHCDHFLDCLDGSDESGCFTTTPNSTPTTTTETTPTTTAVSGVCPLPYYVLGDRCVYVEPFVEGSWDDMRYRCSTFGGLMLEIYDPNYLLDVIKYLKSLGTDFVSRNYWLGGCKSDGIESEYQWYMTGQYVTMGTPFWAIYYNSSDEYIQEPIENQYVQCIFLNKNRKLYFSSGSPSGITASTICQRDLP